jgi:hypothetical protein
MKRVSRQPFAFPWTSCEKTCPSKPWRSGKQTRDLTLDQRGAAALVVMIVILAMALLVVTSTAFIGVDDLDIGYASELSGDVLLSAESCAEEALIRLSRNSSYAGGSLTVGEAACTITVSGTPCGSCTIDVAAVGESYTRNVQVGVNVSGSTVDIISWQEVN